MIPADQSDSIRNVRGLWKKKKITILPNLPDVHFVFIRVFNVLIDFFYLYELLIIIYNSFTV